MQIIDRRGVLRSVTAGAMLGSAAGILGRKAAWADAVPLRLWLQSQWWADDYAAACEKAIGVHVQNTTTANNPTTFSKLMAGGGRDVDLVQIAGPFIPPMADKGILQPIDLAEIPNAKALYPDFAKPDYAFGKDGKHLFVLTRAGIVESSDGGASWGKPVAPPADFKGISDLTWMDYDPVHDVLYLMKMTSELYRLERGK